MALRVIWEYMDRSVTKRILYGPQLSYGSIWTGPSPKKYYMDRSFWGPYNILLVTDHKNVKCDIISHYVFILYYITLYVFIFPICLKNVKCDIITLRFYFPYFSLLAQPVTIFVYGPVTILVYGPARYLHYYFR